MYLLRRPEKLPLRRTYFVTLYARGVGGCRGEDPPFTVYVFETLSSPTRSNCSAAYALA